MLLRGNGIEIETMHFETLLFMNIVVFRESFFSRV